MNLPRLFVSRKAFFAETGLGHTDVMQHAAPQQCQASIVNIELLFF